MKVCMKVHSSNYYKSEISIVNQFFNSIIHNSQFLIELK